MSDSSERALAPRGPVSLATSELPAGVAEVRRALELARQRVARQLDEVQQTLAPTVGMAKAVGRSIRSAAAVRQRVKDAVRRHPALALGGALLAGYGLARLVFRR
jgi:hypothetical protein